MSIQMLHAVAVALDISGQEMVVECTAMVVDYITWIESRLLQFPGPNGTPTRPLRQRYKSRSGFFVLSNAFTGTGRTAQNYIRESMALVRILWSPRCANPRYSNAMEYRVTFDWNNTDIDDQSDRYRNIEIRVQGGSPQMIELVRTHWNNTDSRPIVPVFICHSAWLESAEPGAPRPEI